MYKSSDRVGKLNDLRSTNSFTFAQILVCVRLIVLCKSYKDFLSF